MSMCANQRCLNRAEFEAAVVYAVELGAKTANDVSEMTGLRRGYMAQLLIDTARQGRIQRVAFGVYGPLVEPEPLPPTPSLAAVVKAPPPFIRPLSTQVLMGAHVRRMPLTVSTP